MDTDPCPKCDAATVLVGRLIAGRGAVRFKPPGERFVWWGLPTPPPAVSKDCRVCLTCGFVWTHLRLEDLHAYIDKSCDDATRRKLSPFRKGPPEQDLV